MVDQRFLYVIRSIFFNRKRSKRHLYCLGSTAGKHVRMNFKNRKLVYSR